MGIDFVDVVEICEFFFSVYFKDVNVLDYRIKWLNV